MNSTLENASGYRLMLELVPDIVYTLAADGKITSLSKSFERVTGWSRKDWLGKDFSPIVHPDDLHLASKILRHVLAGKSRLNYTLRVRIKKGSYRIFEFSTAPNVVDGKIIGTIGTARDITRQRRIQEEEAYLAKASKILSSSLDYNKTLKILAKLLVPELSDWCSIHLVNESGKAEQLTVAHQDPKKVEWAMALQNGYYEKVNRDDPDNSVNRIMRTGKSELYPYLTEEILKKVVKRKRDFDLVLKLKIKSAMSVPLSTGKKMFGVITLVSCDVNNLYDEHDLKFAEELGRRAGQAVENSKLYSDAQKEIQHRKKVQEELQASKKQLSVILENVVDGITVFDEKAKVTFVNPAVVYASGYRSIAEMIQSPIKWREIYEVMDENGNVLDIPQLPGRQAVATKKSVQKTLQTLNKKTGEVKWAEVKAKPIIDKEGNLKGAVSVTHDITQAKELERKKDDFISIASHELKTPITSIKGYVHLLKSQHSETDMHYDYLEKVEKQLGKLTELVEDLLELSRLRTGRLTYKKEKFNFSKLVKEVVGDMQVLDKNHKIVLRNGIKKSVIADRERISQVLINLLSNASKYSPESNKIVVNVAKTEEGVRVGVKDYGIGISMREKGKIFDRFYRVESNKHKTFPGLGIGLYLSKEIIDRHNGRIWFTSKKGKGSTFYFQLPKKNE